ncbi:MAG: EVE domain-containing protein, partial [Ignavibacteriae bacterium]|nr:EVE domain-containing protein [Ignavibacteriota bacterium]
VIMGPEESWKTAFKQDGIWGVKSQLYPEWKALDPGDHIFFFITKTVRGIVGVGRVGNKFVQDKPMWPDEIREGRLIYPYRFEFEIDYMIEEPKWSKERISSKEVPLRIQEMRRGINFLQKDTYEKLVKVFQERFRCDLLLNENKKELVARTIDSKPSKTHSELQELIHHVGKMNRLISEKEYPMEAERLDVVWRRVEKSVPTYVFEIQIGGDIYHALGKLKHAHDLWNSNVFIVAQEEEFEKVDLLLDGTFHEIKFKLKKLTTATVNELHTHKKRWVDLERKVGLL